MVHASARFAWVRSLSRFAAVVTLASVSVGGFPGHATATTPGSQLWAKLYNGPGHIGAGANAIGVSPDGSTVFVAGGSDGSTRDYATVAYDAATGAKLRVMTYDGPANLDDSATALGVSPDGSEVFVTGSSNGSSTGYDYATVAYDASTGATLWAKRYNGTANDYDTAYALGVSPDGSQVFVTGVSTGLVSGTDFATVSYDASTGAKLWVKRYAKGDGVYFHALRVSPDGSKVFVTGTSSASANADFATVSYDAPTGANLWVKSYNGPGNGNDYVSDIAVSPNSSEVFVTGASVGSTSRDDYATVAYNASTGGQLWAKLYNGPGNFNDDAHAVGVSPDGTEVFVTGGSNGSTSGGDYATVAYKASTGAKLWLKRYDLTSNDSASALGVSPDGSEVFVRGVSTGSTTGDDYDTVGYDASTGARLWAKLYNSQGNFDDVANALGVSPNGAEVFVTGSSQDPSGVMVPLAATVAYAA